MKFTLLSSARSGTLLVSTALWVSVWAASNASAAPTVFGSDGGVELPRRNTKPLAISAVPEGTSATNSNLRDFGLALRHVDRETIRELAQFSNLLDISWQHPELNELVRYAAAYDMKALLSVHDLFFHRPDPALRLSTLRHNYETRWHTFVSDHREILSYSHIWAIYLVDEPFWNAIPVADLAAAQQVVKGSFPLLPTMASMNRHDLEAAPADLPHDLLDVVGFHAYAVAEDPNLDPDYQHDLRVFLETFPDREYVIVADAWWAEQRHGAAGLAPSDVGERASQYRRVAEDIGAIALGAFVWQTLPEGTGLRDLPEQVLREYIRVGSEISGKCGVPTSLGPLAGEAALYLQGCRFHARVNWRHPETGEEGTGVAVSLSRDTGVFWFFDRSNIELTVKLLDGTGHNGHWWVFWSHMTDLEVWLEITDTQSGSVVRFTEPGSDTLAFPDVD